MTESKVLPLSAVSRQMAVLVSEHGWCLVRSEGRLGYLTQAAIERDGIVISYSNSKGEQDYDVRLSCAVHPVLSRELYRRPELYEVLSAIGVKPSQDNIVLKAAENVSAIKIYLSDKNILEKNIRVTTANLLIRYQEWSVGPDILQDLARSMADRHPWLVTGKAPDPTDLLNAGKFSPYISRRSRRGIVLGAVGMAMVIAHYWR